MMALVGLVGSMGLLPLPRDKCRNSFITVFVTHVCVLTLTGIGPGQTHHIHQTHQNAAPARRAPHHVGNHPMLADLCPNWRSR